MPKFVNISPIKAKFYFVGCCPNVNFYPHHLLIKIFDIRSCLTIHVHFMLKLLSYSDVYPTIDSFFAHSISSQDLSLYQHFLLVHLEQQFSQFNINLLNGLDSSNYKISVSILGIVMLCLFCLGMNLDLI